MKKGTCHHILKLTALAVFAQDSLGQVKSSNDIINGFTSLNQQTNIQCTNNGSQVNDLKCSDFFTYVIFQDLEKTATESKKAGPPTIPKAVTDAAHEIKIQTKNYIKAEFSKNTEAAKSIQEQILKSKTRFLNTSVCPGENPLTDEKCIEYVSENFGKAQEHRVLTIHSRFVPTDPTDQSYQSFESLLKKNITKPEWKGFLDTKETELKKLENPEQVKRVQDIFKKITAMMISKIKLQVSDSKAADRMIAKINQITLNGSNCAREGLDPGEGYLVDNATYYPKENHFVFCNGKLLKGASDESIARTVVHELSHSIDPCNIANTTERQPVFSYSDPKNIAQSEKEFPFKNILSCLRSKNSVGAYRKEWLLKKKDRDGYIKELNKLEGPSFCYGDQITESFADWFAAEILPDYLSSDQKIENSIDTRNVMPVSGDEHPQWTDRINKILMANPKIRSKVGCPEKQKNVEYCSTAETKNYISREKELKEGIDSGRLIYIENRMMGGQLIESKNLKK